MIAVCVVVCVVVSVAVSASMTMLGCCVRVLVTVVISPARIEVDVASETTVVGTSSVRVTLYALLTVWVDATAVVTEVTVGGAYVAQYFDKTDTVDAPALIAALATPTLRSCTAKTEFCVAATLARLATTAAEADASAARTALLLAASADWAATRELETKAWLLDAAARTAADEAWSASAALSWVVLTQAPLERV